MSKIAIIGAGNGGMAFAGYLALIGNEVTLYNRSSTRLDSLKSNLEITLTNQLTGVAKISRVTENISEAIQGNDIIFLTTTSDAHLDIIRSINPFRTEDQLLILNPGGVGGAIVCNSESTYPIAETNILLYACRSSENTVNIKGVKNRVLVYGVESFVQPTIHSLFPQFVFVDSPFETSLNYYNVSAHLPSLYANLSAVLAGKLVFHYKDGVTPGVADLIAEVDEERNNICKTFSVNFYSIESSLREEYGVTGKNLYELYQNSAPHSTTRAPQNLHHRMFFEDIPFGLIPLIDLANIADIRVPRHAQMLAKFNTLKDWYSGARRITDAHVHQYR